MPFLSVPWAIEGGALNQPEGARILAWAATGRGVSGVMGPNDLRVTEMATPGPGVAISTGACVVPCRTPGYPYQAYIASRPTADDTEPVAGNGGASARSDLIVVQVKNPHLSAETWPMPADVAAGPYVEPYVYANVGASVVASRAAALAYLQSNNISAEPLAGVTLPPGVGNVLNSHLIDLRAIGSNNAHSDRRILTFNPSSTTPVTSAAWFDWFTPGAWTVTIPTWATRVAVIGTVGGAAIDQVSSTVKGTAYGQIRVRVGGTAAAPGVATQGTTYDLDGIAGSSRTRHTLITADTVSIPTGLRGTTVAVAVQGIKSSGSKDLYADAGTSVALQLEFMETAV